METNLNLKILIVEDAKVVRKMAIKILNEIGYSLILEAPVKQDSNLSCIGFSG